VAIHVPALRDRPEDIPELAHHFLYRFGRELGLDIRGFDPNVLDRFQRYAWPGNVRELQGVIKASMLRTTRQMVRAESLPPPVGVAVSGPADDGEPVRLSTRPDLNEVIGEFLRHGGKNVYGRVIEMVERELISRTLVFTQGHLSHASDLLGINRTTLRTKMREFGIALEKGVSERAQSDHGAPSS
jgi:two-component system nitrogen regulation response regulator GlnG